MLIMLMMLIPDPKPSLHKPELSFNLRVITEFQIQTTGTNATTDCCVLHPSCCCCVFLQTLSWNPLLAASCSASRYQIRHVHTQPSHPWHVHFHIWDVFPVTGLFQVFSQPLSVNLLSVLSPSSSLCLSPQQSSEEGAVSPIYCAVAEETEGITGKYFDSDCSLVLPAPLARDPALAVKDFEMCERVTSKLWKDCGANGGLITEKGSNPPLYWTFTSDIMCH